MQRLTFVNSLLYRDMNHMFTTLVAACSFLTFSKITQFVAERVELKTLNESINVHGWGLLHSERQFNVLFSHLT